MSAFNTSGSDFNFQAHLELYCLWRASSLPAPSEAHFKQRSCLRKTPHYAGCFHWAIKKIFKFFFMLLSFKFSLPKYFTGAVAYRYQFPGLGVGTVSVSMWKVLIPSCVPVGTKDCLKHGEVKPLAGIAPPRIELIKGVGGVIHDLLYLVLSLDLVSATTCYSPALTPPPKHITVRNNVLAILTGTRT